VLTLAELQHLVIAPKQLDDDRIPLTREQQHYLNRVLRLQVGDRFVAMDGQGQAWLVQLVQADTAQILESVAMQTELPVAVTLIAALPKGNGFDEVVRQSTELGVACIVPVISDRTLLKPSAQKVDRWRKIAQEAAEQSERQIVPQVFEPVSFRDRLISNPVTRYIGVTRHSAPHLLNCLSSDSPAIELAIGCEGGWTEAEVAAAIAVGFQPVSLGKRIFRAVTAPIVALAIVAALYENR
jgi:16S rRNA (uracil1498-N3)-methyltransferase